MLPGGWHNFQLYASLSLTSDLVRALHPAAGATDDPGLRVVRAWRPAAVQPIPTSSLFSHRNRCFCWFCLVQFLSDPGGRPCLRYSWGWTGAVSSPFSVVSGCPASSSPYSTGSGCAATLWRSLLVGRCWAFLAAIAATIIRAADAGGSTVTDVAPALLFDCPHTSPEDLFNGNCKQLRGGKGNAARQQPNFINMITRPEISRRTDRETFEISATQYSQQAK